MNRAESGAAFDEHLSRHVEMLSPPYRGVARISGASVVMVEEPVVHIRLSGVSAMRDRERLLCRARVGARGLEVAEMGASSGGRDERRCA